MAAVTVNRRNDTEFLARATSAGDRSISVMAPESLHARHVLILEGIAHMEPRTYKVYD